MPSPHLSFSPAHIATFGKVFPQLPSYRQSLSPPCCCSALVLSVTALDTCVRNICICSSPLLNHGQRHIPSTFHNVLTYSRCLLIVKEPQLPHGKTRISDSPKATQLVSYGVGADARFCHSPPLTHSPFEDQCGITE